MQKTYFNSYFKQICQYPLLTAEQEIAIAKKIQQGDTSAQVQLINSNLRLVVNIAKKYASDTIDIMDLIQEGNLGLMNAAAKYTNSFNTRFSTYAYQWITQYILRYIQNKLPTINIPYRLDELLRTINKAEGLLTQRLRRKPSCSEIADFLDIPEKKVSNAKSYEFFCSSLNDEIYCCEGLTIADVVSDDRIELEQSLIRDNEISNLNLIVNKLSWKEQQVIKYRYNLYRGDKAKTLRQISEILGVSSETVRQLELKAIGKLRNEVNKLSV